MPLNPALHRETRPDPKTWQGRQGHLQSDKKGGEASKENNFHTSKCLETFSRLIFLIWGDFQGQQRLGPKAPGGDDSSGPGDNADASSLQPACVSIPGQDAP